MGKRTIIYGKGVNDMPNGWTREFKWREMVYQKWHSMLVRCYSEKYQEKYPTYKECTVCERWLLLSNFVEDIKKIDGYDLEKFVNGKLELDKDIKSNGVNKEYSLENCMFVSKTENTKQANKTRDYSNIRGKNNYQTKKIAQYDLDGNLIKIWDCIKQASDELGIGRYGISDCCRHKQKTSGGFVWRYIE